MTQVIIKVIGPPEMHVKQYLFCICFMRLKGSLDIFRKSHEVLALNFDPFGVHLHVETNLGHYNPQCCQLIINITRVIIQTQILSKNRPNTDQNWTF